MEYDCAKYVFKKVIWEENIICKTWIIYIKRKTRQEIKKRKLLPVVQIQEWYQSYLSGIIIKILVAVDLIQRHGPFIRYNKLQVAHAPGMSATYPMHGGQPSRHASTHVPWCMPGSLTSGFLWSRWRGNVPGIPGACATHNLTYLVIGTMCLYFIILHSNNASARPKYHFVNKCSWHQCKMRLYHLCLNSLRLLITSTVAFRHFWKYVTQTSLVIARLIFS